MHFHKTSYLKLSGISTSTSGVSENKINLPKPNTKYTYNFNHSGLNFSKRNGFLIVDNNAIVNEPKEFSVDVDSMKKLAIENFKMNTYDTKNTNANVNSNPNTKKNININVINQNSKIAYTSSMKKENEKDEISSKKNKEYLRHSSQNPIEKPKRPSFRKFPKFSENNSLKRHRTVSCEENMMGSDFKINQKEEEMEDIGKDKDKEGEEDNNANFGINLSFENSSKNSSNQQDDIFNLNPESKLNIRKLLHPNIDPVFYLQKYKIKLENFQGAHKIQKRQKEMLIWMFKIKITWR